MAVNETNTAVKSQENTHQNTLTFEDQVIKKIAGIAANEIKGILSMSGGFMSGLTDRFRSTEDITKGINAEVGEKQVALDLKVIVEYGKNVPAIFSETVNNVKKSVHEMTGLEVVEVNMHVEDVMARSEFEAKTDRDKEQESKRDLE
ncbi:MULTISPECIES: Asp23/Gls24 family envelope stress response protein [Priestia]|uniref:Asp23/Gls24 family envelope stress response protein n=1 Tax=Priestia TaxID=2800373 RepID=UPI00094C9BEC|nr:MULTISPECIES: Asp23/Gls24 family envelope stress response protein [Priestia]MBY0090886.1 Asp23/Gls24 family envelope stress response protein [Priestia aryabhattai]MBY0101177.1 Asp23/Gls24 family envelope stress response protein [Priestia aryabhattai]MCM3306226.1 Asp23/Gls24 family envelope stress response protein [Priestia megaterium]MDH2452441.1 Asp23/Gls24 family envelope stress response protein [Priestia megaterium]MDL5151898.1 Asp23/Gls24 family envelope stress response protein [Priesti